MKDSARAGYRRLLDYNGRPMYVHEQAVLGVIPSLATSGHSEILNTTGKSITAKGDADTVFRELYPTESGAEDEEMRGHLQAVWVNMAGFEPDERKGARLALENVATRLGIDARLDE